MTKPLNTPLDMAVAVVNSASDNIRRVIDKLPEEASIEQHMEVARLQTELAKAAAQIEIGRQLQALSLMATPGQSIRYGMAEVASALKERP